MDSFSVGMALAHEFDLDAPWLLKAAGDLPALRLAADAAPDFSKAARRTYAADLSAVLKCWTRRAAPGEIHADLLRKVASERHLSPDILSFARRHEAYSRRNHGFENEALAIWDDLIASGAPSQRTNHRQRAILLYRLGRFDEADAELRTAVELGISEVSAGNAQVNALMWHANFVEAAQALEANSELLTKNNQVRLAREERANRLNALALAGMANIDEVGHERSEARGFADAAYRILCQASAIATAGQGSAFDEAQEEFDYALALPPDTSDSRHNNAWRQPLTRALDAAVREDLDAFRRHRQEVVGHAMWSTVLDLWEPLIGGEPNHVPIGLKWREPYGDVVSRWQAVVTCRRTVA